MCIIPVPISKAQNVDERNQRELKQTKTCTMFVD